MARERLTTRHWLLTKIKVKLGVFLLSLFIEFKIITQYIITKDYSTKNKILGEDYSPAVVL